MARNLIEFHTDLPDPSQLPAPYPATRAVPDWLKNMPTEQTETLGPVVSQIPTVKQCPPFLEAMTCGYIIPLAGDVTFTMEASGELRFTSHGNLVDAQHPLQVRGSPMQKSLIVKFNNPWVVRTPAGYSTLFLPPLNQYRTPFQVLSGLVETDTYYRQVHFPSICLLRPGQTVTLHRGSPLAQAIPIKREDWQAQIGVSDLSARKQIEQEMETDRHNFYKDRHWKKKGYG
jgi:hypothetical protein